jgi:uncharacterized protein
VNQAVHGEQAGRDGLAPKVDPVMFARRRQVVDGHTPLALMTRLISAGVAAEGAVAWHMEGSVATDDLGRQRDFLLARTRFAPLMTCSRCLAPVRVADIRSETRFRLAASEAQAEREDRESETVEVIAATPVLDLATVVEDEAILALPMAPVHEVCPADV